MAFLVDDKVYSSSAPDQVAKDLRAYLFGPAKAATDAAKAGQVSSPWVVTLNGSEYAGVLAPLPGNGSAKVAYAVLNSRSGAAAVVINASAMPPERTRGSPAPSTEIALNALMIPVTVPSRPNKGEMLAMVPTEFTKRSSSCTT